MGIRGETVGRVTGEVRTLGSVVDGLSAQGGRPALVEFGTEGAEVWSYSELASEVRRLAGGLLLAGVERGDPVALFATNRKEWVVACLAVISAGGVVVPLDAQLGDEVLGHALADSGVRHIFTTADPAGR